MFESSSTYFFSTSKAHMLFLLTEKKEALKPLIFSWDTLLKTSNRNSVILFISKD